MIWVLVKNDHSFVVRYDDPNIYDHLDDLEEYKVWELEREPNISKGESVDYYTGEIIFDPLIAQKGADSPYQRLITEIKQEAARRIEEFAPIWKQQNYLRNADTAKSEEFFAKIDKIRDWSNDLEKDLELVKTLEDFESIQQRLKETP